MALKNSFPYLQGLNAANDNYSHLHLQHYFASFLEKSCSGYESARWQLPPEAKEHRGYSANRYAQVAGPKYSLEVKTGVINSPQ